MYSIFFRVAALALLITGAWMSCSQPTTDYIALIQNGEFAQAESYIREELDRNANLSPVTRLEMQFEIERIARIRKDFTIDAKRVLDHVHKYLPGATQADLRRWEQDKSLEAMVIDGQKRYFKYAHYNLFRINPELKAIKATVDAAQSPATEKFALDQHLQEVISAAKVSGEPSGNPVRFRIRQVITVPKGMVPAGYPIRCWIPFPREIDGRQDHIEICATEPATHILADNQNLQRTIYFERIAQADQDAEFSVEYTYTSRSFFRPIDPDRIKAVGNRPDLQPYLSERPPHIVFSDSIRALSRRIIGNETHPYRMAQLLFEWVDVHIPWASAREYSTFYDIPEYVLQNRHGDCGMQTLTFMTLCRLNGIPTRWQSGWEFQPPDDSMHDWGMIYFEPYGWVPMDVTYGLRESDDPTHRWFYLNGMDSYRLIFNDDYSCPLFPAKIHPRSETIDSQRGEVEWSGGNLYFDQWDWHFSWEIIP